MVITLCFYPKSQMVGLKMSPWVGFFISNYSSEENIFKKYSRQTCVFLGVKGASIFFFFNEITYQ